VSGTLPIGSPVLVRKLARKRHWGSPDLSTDQRIAEILANVFLNDEKPYSLYRVNSEGDLDCVTMALNAGRGSLSEECSFAFFTLEEFQAAKIPLTQTTGNTPCHYANRLHFDAEAAEPQLLSLINQAITSGRDVVRRSRGQMKLVVDQAIKNQCLAAVPHSSECKAPACAASEP